MKPNFSVYILAFFIFSPLFCVNKQEFSPDETCPGNLAKLAQLEKRLSQPNRHTDCMESLIPLNHPIDPYFLRSFYANSPKIFEEIYQNNLEKIKEIIKNNASQLNSVMVGEGSPLNFALAKQKYEIAKYLADIGAKCVFKNNHSERAIFIAILENNIAKVKEIIDDVDTYYQLTSVFDGKYPLEYAYLLGRNEIAEYLISMSSALFIKK